jgi:hypothetical protein
MPALVVAHHPPGFYLRVLGRPEATLAALIPIKKSVARWVLAQDERRAMFKERSPAHRQRSRAPAGGRPTCSLAPRSLNLRPGSRSAMGRLDSQAEPSRMSLASPSECESGEQGEHAAGRADQEQPGVSGQTQNNAPNQWHSQ